MKNWMSSWSFILRNSLTFAAVPAASLAPMTSIPRLPRNPPSASISSLASMKPCSIGWPNAAPGPEVKDIQPNFTGVSGILPFAASSARASRGAAA